MDQVGQQKGHRPQSQDGEGVGGEDQEHLVGVGEDGRDGVDGKDDVGGLDEHQHGQQGSGHDQPALAYQQALAVEGVGHGDEAVERGQDAGLVGIPEDSRDKIPDAGDVAATSVDPWSTA